jgi:hypothetical protein
MKFDLEKELGLTLARAPQQAPWMLIIIVLCGLNLVLAGVALWRSASAPAPAAPQPATVIVQQDTQGLALVSARIGALEHSLRDLRTSVRQSSKELAAVEAMQQADDRIERLRTRQLEKQGVDPADIQRAVRGAPSSQQPIAELTSEQKDALDSLIDADDSGDRVRQFLLELNNPAQLRAYVSILRAKGEQWLEAANVLPDDNPDFAAYTDNALYFLNIISAVSSDSSTVAYVESKRTQSQLALQNRRLRQENAERSAQTQEGIAALEERLKPKETAEQAQARRVDLRRSKYIKDYPVADAVKPYATDWDPDPRVREERGIE